MKHQKARNRTRPKAQDPMTWFALALMVLFVGSLVALRIIGRQEPSKRQASGAQSTPQMTEQELKDIAWDPQWPPLPNAGKPAKPIERVRAMYAFAARHPEVMRYAPCYCGCEAQGHMSAEDCFVRGRDAGGEPQWDGMGFT
jgi:hypothetical protein